MTTHSLLDPDVLRRSLAPFGHFRVTVVALIASVSLRSGPQ